MKAQILLQCAHDALTELGPERIGCLFGAPLSVRLEESEQAVVEGWRFEEPVDLNVDCADVRWLFMQTDRIGDFTWLYPAPDEASGDKPMQCTAASTGGCNCLDSSDDLTASITASSPQLPGIIMTTAGNEFVGKPRADRSCTSPATGMKRVDSWMNDKFTAQPTRSNFPPLSDRNFLLADGANDSTPEPDCTRDAASNTSLHADRQAGPPLEGTSMQVHSLQMTEACASAHGESLAHLPSESGARSSEAMSAQKGTNEAPDVIAGTAEMIAASPSAQVGCQVAWRSAGSSASAMPKGCDGAVAEAQQCKSCGDLDTCACEPCGAMPYDVCRVYPNKRGILIRPDNGLRLSERQVLVEQLPPLLICHLNRFQQSVTGTRKNALHVSFPFHLFVHPDIAVRNGGAGARPDDAVRYRLKAVLEHHGRNISGGHYTCYAWRPSACASVAAELASSLRTQGRSQPMPVPKNGSKRKGRKDNRRNGLASASVSYSSKFGISEDSVQLSHCESIHSGDTLPHNSGASVDAGLAACQGSLRNDARSAVAELVCECADELDWEEIADNPQELQSALSKTNIFHDQHTAVDAGELPEVSIARVGVESMSLDDTCVEADRSLHLHMSSDQEEDIGIWVRCDDECIEEVPWQTVSSAQAYMLMYEQAS